MYIAERYEKVSAALKVPVEEGDSSIGEACCRDDALRAEVARMLENRVRVTQEEYHVTPNPKASFVVAPADAVGTRIGP